MKKHFYFFLLIFSLSLNYTYSQATFWLETFGTGCNQGDTLTPYTPRNPSGQGNWTATYLGYSPSVTSGSDMYWISATESQTTTGSCSSSCLAMGTNDKCLHIGNGPGGGNTPLCPGGDCGALYNAGISANLRAESPSISTIGQNSITLSFDYLEFGDLANDDASVFYKVGAGAWTLLGNMVKTNCGTNSGCSITACTGFVQGIWSNYTATLPNTTWNQAGIQIGFLWVNNGDNAGTDPSFAVDNVRLMSPTSFTPAFTLVSPACSGSSQGATVTVNPSTVTASGYTWTASPAGPTFGSPNGSSTGITFPSAGTFSITVTMSVSGQGTASATQTILVNATPTVNITSTSASVCAGGSATLTANSTGATSWNWTPSTGLSSTTSSVTVASPSTPQVYTVQAINGTCTGTAQVSVGINPALSLTVSASPSSVCSGGSSTLTVNGGTSYNWSPGSSLNSTSGSVVIATPTSNTTYTVVGTSGSCTGTANISVSVTGALPISVSPTSATICPGGNTTLSASGATNYTWSPSGALSSSSGQTVTANPTSNTTYTVLGATGTCTGMTTVNVHIGSPLTVTIAPASPTTCVGGPSATLIATGATNYQWTPTVGLSSSTGAVVLASPTTQVTYTVLGTAGTCTGSAVKTVSVIVSPNLSITPTSTVICYGTSYTYSASGAFTYTWAPPTPSANAFISPVDTNYAQVVLNPTVTTTYTVTGMNTIGCPTPPKTVTLNVVPIPTATLTLLTNTLGINTNSICAQFGVNTATASVATSTLPPEVAAYHYSWSPGKDIYGNLDNDTVKIDPNIPCTQPNYLTTYTVTAYYESLPNCKAQDTVSLRVINCFPPQLKTLNSPGFVQVPINDTLCEKQCTVLKNNLCGGDTMTVFWSIPGAIPDTITSKFPITVCFPVAPYNYTVTMNVTNPYGSYFYISKPQHYIHVVDTPDAVRASADPIGIRDTCIRYGSCVTLHALNLGPHTYVSWYPPDNLDNHYSANPVACPTVNTTYILTAYNSKKCKYNDTVTVCVDQDCGDMFVPNAFSPNNDGHNDVLYVRGKCLSNMIFMIFNRWGEKVFESSNQADGWDGTYKGVLMNTAVFVYRLEGTTYDGKSYSKKGNITLMR